MTTPDIRGLIAKWRERYPADDEGAWQTLECADELEALLSEAAPQETPEPPHVREDYREVWLSGWRAGKGEAAPPAQSGWQPIETAPKDGRYLILGQPARHSKTMLADISRWTDYCEDEFDSVPCWSSWRWHVQGPPTHWMPLPAPPLPPTETE